VLGLGFIDAAERGQRDRAVAARLDGARAQRQRPGVGVRRLVPQLQRLGGGRQVAPGVEQVGLQRGGALEARQGEVGAPALQSMVASDIGGRKSSGSARSARA
jgi:hypothetical protein